MPDQGVAGLTLNGHRILHAANPVLRNATPAAVRQAYRPNSGSSLRLEAAAASIVLLRRWLKGLRG
jgi:hypothetical protein